MSTRLSWLIRQTSFRTRPFCCWNNILNAISFFYLKRKQTRIMFLCIMVSGVILKTKLLNWWKVTENVVARSREIRDIWWRMKTSRFIITHALLTSTMNVCGSRTRPTVDSNPRRFAACRLAKKPWAGSTIHPGMRSVRIMIPDDELGSKLSTRIKPRTI